MTVDVQAVTAEVQGVQPRFMQAKEEMKRVIVGQEELLTSLLMGLLADGHLLLEGLPGLAKTLAVNTLAKVTGCEFKRIQFTPDLLPADLTGTVMYVEGKFSVKKGPVFTEILLADEINRAPAKVQSALLEVMQERQVTLGGETYPVGKPFLVLATQNPIEQEGTYILPEAQTDRFLLKVLLSYPSQEEEKEILYRMAHLNGKPEAKAVLSKDDILKARKVVDTIYLDPKVVQYIVNIVEATRRPKAFQAPIEGLLQFGASPRATLGFVLASKAHAFLEGRGYVLPEDVKKLAFPILRHRLRRTYEAEAEEVTPDAIIQRLLDAIPVP